MSEHSGYGTFTPVLPAQSSKFPDGTIQHSADTINKLNKLLVRLKANQLINAKANEYYTRCNSKMVYPAIFISAVSSIASFMTTSSEINDNMKSAFGISVGIITTISTMMQAISSAAGYGTKAAAFLDAADSYSKLITNVQFEIDMPDENKLEFFNKMEDAILKINEKRKILPPLFIATPIMDKYHNEIQKMDNSITSTNSIGSNNSLAFANNNVPMMRQISNGIKNIFTSSTNTDNTDHQDLIDKNNYLENTIINIENENRQLRENIDRITTDMNHIYRENKLYKELSENSNNMLSTVSNSNKIITDSLVAIVNKNILESNQHNIERPERQHYNSPINSPINTPINSPVSFARSLSPINMEILKPNEKKSIDIEHIEINIPNLENDEKNNQITITDNTLTTSSI